MKHPGLQYRERLVAIAEDLAMARCELWAAERREKEAREKLGLAQKEHEETSLYFENLHTKMRMYLNAEDVNEDGVPIVFFNGRWQITPGCEPSSSDRKYDPAKKIVADHSAQNISQGEK